MSRHITVFDPFRMMPEEFFSNRFSNGFNSLYPVDVTEDDDTINVELEVPGYQKDEISINVKDGVLTITGRKNETTSEESNKKEKKYLQKEIRREDQWTRSISLPTLVHAEAAKAKFKDGILTIELPKAPEVKPRPIEIIAD